jgi:exodeoxyribonuclease III
VKIATYNANSVRQRLPLILDWLAENEPDVLVLQETKCEDAKFPLNDFEECGYHVAVHGQKTWNGVAIISRPPLQNVRTGFNDPLWPDDCRIITADVEDFKIINTYVPNGTAVNSDKFEYKLKWLQRFRQMLDERYRPTDNVVWLGDINIAPTPDDVYNSKRFYGGVGHHPLEFELLDRIKEWGLTDMFRKFTPGPGHYTYWDFIIITAAPKNFGWRIDHVYASPPAAGRCTSCVIDRQARFAEKPSDHTFVIAEFE